MRQCFLATMMWWPSCSSTRKTTARLQLLMDKRGRRRAWTACSRPRLQNLQRLLHGTFHEAKKYIYIYLDAQASETCKSLVCCLKWCALLFVCLNYNVHMCEHWVCKLLNIWYLNICDLVFTVSVYCRLIISTHTVSKVITLCKVCLVLYLLIFG